MGRKCEDLTGQKFGLLTVVSKAINSKHGDWNCICECGGTKIVTGSNLKRGFTKSCGCMQGKKMNENAELECINNYEISEDGYMIGYTSKNEKFFFDIDDFDDIKKYNWYIRRDGYVASSSNGKHTKMHTLIMSKNNEIGDYLIDHINHNKTDNRKSNLRLVTNSQNQMNKGLVKSNTSGCTGISWHKNKNVWIAQIQINNKLKYLGVYDNIEEAIKARKDAEKKYFGEYAYNPDSWDLLDNNKGA